MHTQTPALSPELESTRASSQMQGQVNGVHGGGGGGGGKRSMSMSGSGSASGAGQDGRSASQQGSVQSRFGSVTRRLSNWTPKDKRGKGVKSSGIETLAED